MCEEVPEKIWFDEFAPLHKGTFGRTTGFEKGKKVKQLYGEAFFKRPNTRAAVRRKESLRYRVKLRAGSSR